MAGNSTQSMPYISMQCHISIYNVIYQYTMLYISMQSFISIQSMSYISIPCHISV